MKGNLVGLSLGEVEKLHKQYGLNILSEEKKISPFKIFALQFKNPLIYILGFAALISFVFRDYGDLALLVAVVLLNALMGFYQEYRAQKTFVSLRSIIKPKAIVIREGKRQEIETSELVLGDLVILVSGDKVPADGVMVEGVNLFIQEAILTGEEEAIEKKPILNSSVEKNNLCYMGTQVVAGRGILRVEKIGKDTEIGKIDVSLLEIEEGETPIQKKMAKLAKNLAYIIFAISIFIFVLGIYSRHEIISTFKLAVILAVAAIPEGLPVATTVILSLGMKKILKRNGLVKKLASAETLGSTSVICTDKTGTLTLGQMKVAKSETIDNELLSLALILGNNQRSSLELCLWQFIKEKNYLDPNKIDNEVTRIYEEPFDSEKKYSLTVSFWKEKQMGFITGAPEIVLNFCNLSKEEKEKKKQLIENWADDGLKVLGVACKEGGEAKELRGYQWLGLLGIEDLIRPEAKEALAQCQEAGIKVKIVTGDYRKTTERIAERLEIKFESTQVMEGDELETISEEDLRERIDNLILFTRVKPHHKLKIVNALQQNGEVVAMVGDGVNDALALKKADIGISVENATEIAKEASDLILLDGNFQTIVAACEEGRLITANIKRVVGYVLSNSFVEMVLIFGSYLLGLPLPLTVAQILWIHFICDGPPDILLSFEPKSKYLMKQKPSEVQRTDVLDNSMKILIGLISLSIGGVVLYLFNRILIQNNDILLARTFAFTAVGLADLIYIFSFKDLDRNIFKIENFFKNIYLFLGVVYGLVLLLLALYFPFFNRTLGTKPLTLNFWFLALAVGLLGIIWTEVSKVLKEGIRKFLQPKLTNK